MTRRARGARPVVARVAAACGLVAWGAACARPTPRARATPPAAPAPAAPATAGVAAAPAYGPGYAPTAAESAFLDTLGRRTFDFFWETTDPRTGLTPDRWPTRTFSSVAAIGFALTAYPIGAERGWVTRDAARARALATLRFLWALPQGAASTGVAGHRGFFYHFLDYERGLRFERVELSTIDTALLLAGALTCREYFDTDAPDDVALRALADSLYHRADWRWAQDGRALVSMGWRPDPAPHQNARGFIETSWFGYTEAMILYALALGSPTHPVDPAAWTAFTRTYRWDRFHGQEFVQFAPLFGHQYSHVWLDLRGIRDPYMRARSGATAAGGAAPGATAAGGAAPMDYFENSRRATLAQRAYATANPGGWRGYGPSVWGLTASDGALDSTLVVPSLGRAPRTFHTYWARGAGTDEINDDGTIAPTAAGGSIAFAPEIVVPALVAMRRLGGAAAGDAVFGRYGFLDAVNLSLTDPALPVRQGRIVPGLGWVGTDYLGIDQGPILAMLENWRTGLVWRLLRRNADVTRGLCRAGFRGGWLEGRCLP